MSVIKMLLTPLLVVFAVCSGSSRELTQLADQAKAQTVLTIFSRPGGGGGGGTCDF
ncbi:hypothetical protein WDW37_18980 [Bdellovibrionota bacterium FG-1]